MPDPVHSEPHQESLRRKMDPVHPFRDLPNPQDSQPPAPVGGNTGTKPTCTTQLDFVGFHSTLGLPAPGGPGGQVGVEEGQRDAVGHEDGRQRGAAQRQHRVGQRQDLERKRPAKSSQRAAAENHRGNAGNGGNTFLMIISGVRETNGTLKGRQTQMFRNPHVPNGPRSSLPS